MDLIKSYEFFKPETLGEKRIHIIGCGSVGSTLAENLARFGIKNFTLYDFDKVESRNIVNQMFTNDDVGKLKTEAVTETLKKINPEVNVKVFNDGWHGQRLSGYVFLCPDSIEVRRNIVESNMDNTFIKAMFDFRTRLTDAQHFACDWSDESMKKSFLNSMQFSHEEASAETPVSACGVTLSVVPTIRLIVGLGVSNFINFAKGQPIKKLIMADAFNFNLDAF